MGLHDVFDSLKRITCDHRYRHAVEWLGCPWGHAVAPSTPVQDYRLHVKAWQQHFAALFGGYGGRGDDRDRGNNPIALLAMIILAPIAAMLIQMAISRSREFAADAGGAAITGNPYGLADALRKIDAVSKRVPLDANPATAHMFIIKPFSAGALFSLFSTHPPTEKRIQALLHTA